MGAFYCIFQDSVRQLLSSYLHRFSTLAGPVITCGPVLNWLELDNRGHRLIVTDDCAINTPAVAAAYAIKRYAKQASDEISFEVGVLYNFFSFNYKWRHLRMRLSYFQPINAITNFAHIFTSKKTGKAINHLNCFLLRNT